MKATSIILMGVTGFFLSSSPAANAGGGIPMMRESGGASIYCERAGGGCYEVVSGGGGPGSSGAQAIDIERLEFGTRQAAREDAKLKAFLSSHPEVCAAGLGAANRVLPASNTTWISFFNAYGSQLNSEERRALEFLRTQQGHPRFETMNVSALSFYCSLVPAQESVTARVAAMAGAQQVFPEYLSGLDGAVGQGR